MEPITNRVAESDIEVYDLAALWDGAEIVELDLEPFLVEGLVLREQHFRSEVKAHDWAAYDGRHVAVFCSADAIVPTWAYMLVAAKLDGAASVTAGTEEEVRRARFAEALAAHDWARYEGVPVVLKGCGNDVVPLDGFVQATRHLQGVASKVMYGEPCSSVPVWRRPSTGAAKPTGARPAVSKPAGVKPARPPR